MSTRAGSSGGAAGRSHHPPITFDENDLKEGLQECLENIQSSGSFALFEQAANAPNPGIHLKNGGPIGLPLSERDAEAIIDASHAAPFGMGEQTLVDVRVRKTWEVAPADFEIRNPAWKAFVKGLAARVAAGLGVDSTGKGVRAELYKMLLYDKGAMFKPHQDSEKAPRMFATLVVALPSKHEGGEVRVTHAGKTEVFETSKFSESGTSYLAWFADVIHEVKPVLSGRRLVLTYNLIHTTFNASQFLAASSKGLDKLRSLLIWWKDNAGEEASSSYAYLLEHQYTAASLCFDGSKGHDRQILAQLRQVCDEQGFSLYLANLDISIEGGCDEDYDGYDGRGPHEITEEIDRTVNLKRVVQLDGTEVAQDLFFDEETFIQEEPLKNQKPDSEDYSGYTGNEGVSTTHFYHRTVVIMMPKKERPNFFFPPTPTDNGSSYDSWMPRKTLKSPKVGDWIVRLSGELSQDPADQETRDFLENICRVIIQRTKIWTINPPPVHFRRQINLPPFSDENISLAITTLVDINSKDYLAEACSVLPSEVTSSAWRSIGIALLKLDLQSLLPTLSTKLAEVTTLSDRFHAIDALKAGLEAEAEVSANNEEISVLTDWIKSEIYKAISTAHISSAEDGLVLSKISRMMSTKNILAKVVPVVKRNTRATLMAISFVNGIFDTTDDDTIPDETARDIFWQVLPDLARRFSLKVLDNSNILDPAESLLASRASNQQVYSSALSRQLASRPKKMIVDVENGRQIATVLCHCQELDRFTLDKILVKLCSELESCEIEMFEHIYLPLLKALKTLILDLAISVPDTPFPSLFRQILVTYIDRFVQAQPSQTIDWTRPMVSCSCQDCGEMNFFLDSATEKVGRFKLVQKRRDHLQRTAQSKHPSFRYETDRESSPQTLVITKTNAVRQGLVTAWKKRRTDAKKHLSEIGDGFLKELLGNAYQQVKSMSVSASGSVASASASASPGPSYSTSNRVLPPVSRRKTPHEVIFIDDD